jgi:hypothetical protein
MIGCGWLVFCCSLVLKKIIQKIGFKALPCKALVLKTKTLESPDKNSRIPGQSIFEILAA